MRNRSLVVGGMALALILIGVLLVTSVAYGASAVSVSGKVFDDRNANGVLDDGETGTAGVTVRLYRDLNGNGLVDRDDRVVAAATTGSDGRYRLPVSEAAHFVVQVDVRSLPHGERLTTSGQHAIFVPSLRARPLPAESRAVAAPSRPDDQVAPADGAPSAALRSGLRPYDARLRQRPGDRRLSAGDP